MSRYLTLIAYEPWDWSTATEEVRATFFEQHGAFAAEHGRELTSAALDDTDTAVAAVRLLPPSYSLEIRPIVTIT